MSSNECNLTRTSAIKENTSMQVRARPVKQSRRRRDFLKGSAAVLASCGTAAISYGRVLGSNDRISLGHIGVGRPGRALAGVVSLLKDKFNVEVTAVCDLWKTNRELAQVAAQKHYGRAP